MNCGLEIIYLACSLGFLVGVSVAIGCVLAFGGRIGPARPEDSAIAVHPEIRVDWKLIHAALAGAGMTAVHIEGERPTRH